MNKRAVELGDIQGLLRFGYGSLRQARFLLLRIDDPKTARRWIAKLATSVTTAADGGLDDRAVNVAFTCSGLEALGVSRAELAAFPRELQEGMTAEHRRRVLGDFGASDPERWSWGGPRNQPVHAVLFEYASTGALLEELSTSQAAAFEGACTLLWQLDTRRLPMRKEHFGFRDGIGQPEIHGFREQRAGEPVVATGEFVLGYRNESGQLPEAPRDLGRNGSYLVVRQLEQHVRKFWAFLDEVSAHADGTPNERERIALAAKMVGRWPSGAPLVCHPNVDPHADATEDGLPADDELDRFLYHEADPHGFRCPIGAHIRRSNPRDTLAPNPEVSLRNLGRRRILRRGRAYGEPIAESMSPPDILASNIQDGGRGLHFVCCNTDIAGQFEFLQQSWVNSPKFESIFYDSADPITGAHDERWPHFTGTFTVEAEPVRRRVTGVPRFVDVRGGAYFFMPGIRALRRLGEPG